MGPRINETKQIPARNLVLGDHVECQGSPPAPTSGGELMFPPAVLAKAAQQAGRPNTTPDERDVVGMWIMCSRWSKWKGTIIHDPRTHNSTNAHNVVELDDDTDEGHGCAYFDSGVKAEAAGQGQRW